MKSSHSCCRKLHKALLNSRRCYCTVELYCVAENFIAQQKVLLHNRKFYYTAEGFTAQQKVLLHNKKVRPVAETEDKPTLQRLLMDFRLNVCAQIGSGRMVLWSPFSRAPGQLPS